MPGIHKNPTLAFRPNAWERAIIEQRAAMSGLYKKDFISQSCIYSKITIEGRRENIQRILDAVQEMHFSLGEVAGQIRSGDFSLPEEDYRELKEDYLALAVTLVDILDGAAYLFGKEPPSKRRDWKAEMRVDQLREALKQGKFGSPSDLPNPADAGRHASHAARIGIADNKNSG